MTARRPISQSAALLALVGAALAGFLAGGGFELARGAPEARPEATPAAPAAPRDGFGSVVTRVMPRFNHAHLEQRVLLANSVTSGEQARAAGDLALEYALAARELERLGGADGAAAAAVALLEQLAEGYDGLATAARVRDAGAYAEAAAEIRTREGRLRALLRALNRS